jgi:CheY-like chemotaxis protein
MKKLNCILLIDDDPIANFINTRLLKSLSITEHISIMKNGVDATKFLLDLEKRGENCPELIFLDINMPVMDGFEFYHTFQKLKFSNTTPVKFIVLSTSSYFNDIEKFEKMGVSDFIYKPITKEKLLPVLKKMGITIK